MQTVEVRASSSWGLRLGCIGLLLVPLAGMFFLGAVKGVSDGAGGRAALFLLLGLASLGCFLYFPLSARSWARRFDEHGVTRKSGRVLPAAR